MGAPPSPSSPASPLAALADILGPEALLADPDSRARYARSTLGPGTQPLAIALPNTRRQVQQIVQAAARHNLHLYPISRGKNWGYGDACAPRPGQVILDLSRLNRIVEVNEQLGYAVIEAGVSQGQLYDYLQAHHPHLWMDATGAGRDSSFVGNTLDRGFGHTRYGDHFLTTCGMEVVLADGRILRTGYSHYQHAQAARAYRYGIGPFLDGLFAQSNYGIVTEIGLWLMPKPEDFSAFFISAENPAQLEDLIDRIAPLRNQGLLQSTIHIANDLRTISARMRYPWQRAGGKTPLPADLRAELRKEIGIGAWNGCGAIYGTRGTVAATRKALQKALGGRFTLRFLDDRKLALARRVHKTLGWFGAGKKLGELLDVITPVYGLLKGIPSDDALKGASWRVRDPDPGTPIDPLDSHAGILWVSPVAPTTGHHAREVLSIVEPIYQAHGFEALVTFTMITERAMCCVTNLAFDTRQPEEAARAQACYNALMTALMSSGYQPYRTGPQGFAKLSEGSQVFWEVARQLKQTLDPNGIISPGRYEPA